MEFPSAKEIKKLADACRKAGIISFKGCGIEFTLSDEAPRSPAQRRAQATPVQFVEQTDVETDDLTPDQLLFYSVGGGVTAEDEKVAE